MTDLKLSAFQESLRDIPQGPFVSELIQKTIYKPVNDILSRPSKEVRGQLTSLGYQISGNTEKNLNSDIQCILNTCHESIECLHAGSLIIDDIQDNSEVRRGSPTIHKTYGVPLALNAGNWMYFYAFEPLKKLKIKNSILFQIYERVQETLLMAHFGQALDLSTKIDEITPEQIQEVSLASLKLKTGALMALALELGAIVGEADEKRIKLIHQFGIDLGVCLQMFDDVGNLNPHIPTAKHLEDLQNKRPSFVWYYLAQNENLALLNEFKKIISDLSNLDSLKSFIEVNQLKTKMWNYAWTYFTKVMSDFKLSLESEYPKDTIEKSSEATFNKSLNEIYKIGERIAHAYE